MRNLCNKSHPSCLSTILIFYLFTEISILDIGVDIKNSANFIWYLPSSCIVSFHKLWPDHTDTKKNLKKYQKWMLKNILCEINFTKFFVKLISRNFSWNWFHFLEHIQFENWSNVHHCCCHCDSSVESNGHKDIVVKKSIAKKAGFYDF